MTYGIEQYGIDPYGGLSAADLAASIAIVSATPISTHVVRVLLSKTPQLISAQLPGDALNPRTWKIVRTDTGVGFTILSISVPNTSKTVDVRVLEALGSSNIEHLISADTLLDSAGNPVTPPSALPFFGLLSAALASHDRRVADSKFAIRDLNNPQGALPSGSTGGVYSISSAGDYQLHDGTDFVRKLIFRRLMTSKGGFRFLPGFGVGLRVKEPVPAGDLISLQKEIEDQVKLEPEVDKVRVSVAQDQNSLTVVVLARLKTTGQQISLPIAVPFGVNL